MGGSRSGGKGMCWGGAERWRLEEARPPPDREEGFPTFPLGKAGRSPLFSVSPSFPNLPDWEGPKQRVFFVVKKAGGLPSFRSGKSEWSLRGRRRPHTRPPPRPTPTHTSANCLCVPIYVKMVASPAGGRQRGPDGSRTRAGKSVGGRLRRRRDSDGGDSDGGSTPGVVRACAGHLCGSRAGRVDSGGGGGGGGGQLLERVRDSA